MFSSETRPLPASSFLRRRSWRCSAKRLGRLLVGDDVEHLAGVGDAVEAQDLDRRRGTGLGQRLPLVAQHRADLARVLAGDHEVADLERPVLDQDGRDGAARAIEARLDDVPLGRLVRVGLAARARRPAATASRAACRCPAWSWPRRSRRSCRRPTPPRPGRARRACCGSDSGLAPGLSILLTATTIGTCAALAWLMASMVCGIGPSSAATTRTTMSVIWAPRARMAVNASWPGVSRNTTSPLSPATL